MELKRITEEEMNAQGVIAAPDILNGTAAQNKAIFDRMVRSLVAPAVNACVDALEQLEDVEAGVRENEEGRVAAEEQRDAAERLRLAAETERETNEEQRVTNESNRNFWDDFDKNAEYVPGNKVYYAGSSYLNKIACKGIFPTQTTYWQIIARGGSGGEGETGADGFSPVVEMSKKDGVTTLTITDRDSVQTATIEDGVSPAIDVSKSGKVTTLTIQDAEGTKTVTIYDGEDGKDGEDGADGEGAAGSGVPAGGTAGQVLTKKSAADYDTEWKDVPEGGTGAEEVLIKDIDMSAWYDGEFTVTYDDGTNKTGSVVFDSNNRPKTITLNGHTLTLTLPEVE